MIFPLSIMEKEVYFTTVNMNEKALGWQHGKELLSRRHEKQKFEPGSAALMILDMQDYFLSSESHAFVPSARAIIPAISDLISSFYRAERPVIFTRHTSNDSPSTMLEWWNDSITDEDERSKIIPELDRSRGIVLKKSTYDAFLGTELESLLHVKGVRQVVITGVMTHLCCETTARSAFNLGFSVFFPLDGTATYNSTFHLATLFNLSHGFAVPIRVAQLLEVFS